MVAIRTMQRQRRPTPSISTTARCCSPSAAADGPIDVANARHRRQRRCAGQLLLHHHPELHRSSIGACRHRHAAADPDDKCRRRSPSASTGTGERSPAASHNVVMTEYRHWRRRLSAMTSLRLRVLPSATISITASGNALDVSTTAVAGADACRCSIDGNSFRPRPPAVRPRPSSARTSVPTRIRSPSGRSPTIR